MGKDNIVWRFERKFFINDMLREEVEMELRKHPSFFHPIYHERHINNIYLDSVDFKNYFDNVDGKAQRLKYRIRWYGDLFGYIAKPVLELKIKEGLLGRKRSFVLKPFTLDKNFTYDMLLDAARGSDLPEDVMEEMLSFRPALLNRYRRKYFQEVSERFRVTIDDHLNFYKIDSHHNTFANHTEDRESLIVELKYDEDHDEIATEVSHAFSFRMTKSSKYVSGVDYIYRTL